MLNLKIGRFVFAASWRITCIAFLAIGLFIRLGYWQLHRGDEKRQLLVTYQQEAKQTPVTFPQHQSPRQYQYVQVKGYYLPATLLLDNQHQQHQFGYDVLSPLMLSNGVVVMIDRGWVRGDPGRKVLPSIVTPTHPITLIGQVYYPSKQTWLLGSGLEIRQDNLAIIETLDATIMRQFLHKPLYPFIIRLSAESPDGYVRDWPIIASTPSRHYGYALQWFLFAVIAGMLWVLLNVKKKK